MRHTPAPAVTRAILLVGLSLLTMKAGAEGLEPFEHTFADGTVIRFSGQINMGVLSYDDGQQTNTNFVDNDNSSSRVRLLLYSTAGEWKIESTLEAEYQPLASNTVSQLNDTPDWDFPATNIRKAEVAFASERFGKFWFGQGSMASDGSAEVDNSGTSVIAYSSLSDTAGAEFFRFAGGALSSTTVGSAFSNYDGLGRKVRFRYDTPTYNGFGLRASYGEDLLGEKNDPLYDIAATYSGEFEQFELDGALAFSRNDGTETDILSGSVSALHKDSGISLTIAAAQEYNNSVEGYYGYAKLGYAHDFFEIGSTAFSIDAYYGRDIAAAGSTSTSVGLAAVQNIDKANLQLWALWRNYHYDADDGDYDDGQAVFGGALFKF